MAYRKENYLWDLGSETVKEKQNKKENADRKQAKKQPMSFLQIFMNQIWTSDGIVVIYLSQRNNLVFLEENFN